MEYTLATENIWFPNQKEPVYNPDNPEDDGIFKAYWRKEKERCMYGFTLADGQVRIPGRLYFHTVYWKIAHYITIIRNGQERKIRKIITPLLLDTVWDIFQDLETCSDEGKFYALVGSRDFGKSITAASCAGWLYTFFDKSESVISSGEAKYIKLATDKIEDGLISIHPMFKKQRLTSDWKKEVTAGWKDKQTGLANSKSSFSTIKVVNYDGGTKSMAAVGTRPGFHLIDEIGTILNLLGCVKDSDGAWWSGQGGEGNKPSCLAMFAGTGGDMDVGKEAGEMFFKPDAYNILAFPNPEVPGTMMGRFIDALSAKLNYKEKVSLADHLGIQHPDLQDIFILVTNKERALKEWYEPALAKAMSSGNSKTITKFKAYWPLVASDSFLVLTKNDYNVEAAKAQQRKLRQLGFVGSCVELYDDGEGIKHKFSPKLPITEFPVKTQDPDAPIVVLEFPMEKPPFGLYVCGVDNYRQGKAEYSDSLGSVAIFKRMHDVQSEKFQDMFVAYYDARPDDPDVWSEQARMLIKWYNARTLCENDDLSFINYMISKHEGHYLEDAPEWARLYVPNSTTLKNRPKGLSRSSEKIRDMLRGGQKRYLDEIISVEKDEHGNIIKETRGVSRVLDPMYLEEIINFNETVGNYDREVSRSLAIALSNHLDPILGKIDSLDNARTFAKIRKPIVGSKLFLPQKTNSYKPKKHKLFVK